MELVKYLTTLFVALCFANAQDIDYNGPCPKREFIRANISNYTGTWYNIATYGIPKEAISTKCDEIVFTQDNSGFNLASVAVLQQTNEIIQSTSEVEPQSDGSFIIKSETLMIDIPVEILNTDYTNFAVVNSCLETELGPHVLHTEKTYIQTRRRYQSTKDIPADIYNHILEAVNNAKLDDTFYFETDNRNCPQDE